MPRKRKFWFIDVNADENGQPQITLPDDMKLMEHWEIGDKIVFVSDGWGNWQILRVDEQEPGNWELKGAEDASEVSTD